MGTVLVIEDREFFAKKMQKHLNFTCSRRGLPCEIFFVKDTTSAVQLLDETPFDLISVGGCFPLVHGETPMLGAGISMLHYLDSICFRSPVIFFSSSFFDICEARKTLVAGRHVLTYQKARGKDVPTKGFATAYDWAYICSQMLVK